jgi:hypothetical protein
MPQWNAHNRTRIFFICNLNELFSGGRNQFFGEIHKVDLAGLKRDEVAIVLVIGLLIVFLKAGDRSRYPVTQALADSSLCAILDEHVERSIALNVIWPSGRNLPPKLRVFIDFLHEHLKC